MSLKFASLLFPFLFSSLLIHSVLVLKNPVSVKRTSLRAASQFRWYASLVTSNCSGHCINCIQYISSLNFKRYWCRYSSYNFSYVGLHSVRYLETLSAYLGQKSLFGNPSPVCSLSSSASFSISLSYSFFFGAISIGYSATSFDAFVSRKFIPPSLSISCSFND